MSDVDNNVIALMVLQEENKQLEDSLKELGGALNSLGSINQMLELENKQLKNKLDKIEQIVKDYDGSQTSMIRQFSLIQKVLEQE